MKIVLDTNVLVRKVVRDDARQAELADRLLDSASALILGNLCLCEFVWVLRAGYKLTSGQIAEAIRLLQRAANIQMDDAAVEAGLLMLDAGGDFADGLIAYEGARMGGKSFASFDRKAVRLLRTQGHETTLLE